MTKRQKRILKRRIERLIERGLCILGTVMIIWFCVSWVEVITHSMDDHHNYWDGNMFVQMTASLEK